MTTARMMQSVVVDEKTALLPKRVHRARNKKSKGDHRDDVSLDLFQVLMQYYFNRWKPSFLKLDDIKTVLNLGSLNKTMNALMKNEDYSSFFLLNNYNQVLLSSVHQLLRTSLVLNNNNMMNNIKERFELRDNFKDYAEKFPSRFVGFLFGVGACDMSSSDNCKRTRDFVACAVFGALCCVLPLSATIVLLMYDPALVRAADSLKAYMNREASYDSVFNSVIANVILFIPLVVAVSIGVIILMSALRSSYEFPLYFGRIGLNKYRTSGVDASFFSASDEDVKAYLSDVSDQMEVLKREFDSHFKINEEDGALSVAKPAVSLITLSGMFAHSPNYTKVAKPVVDVESQVRAMNV